MYQFSFGTWQIVGGAGDPAAASRHEQTWRAWLLLSRHGAGHWPAANGAAGSAGRSTCRPAYRRSLADSLRCLLAHDLGVAVGVGGPLLVHLVDGAVGVRVRRSRASRRSY